MQAEEHAQKYEERLERALDYLSNNVSITEEIMILLVIHVAGDQVKRAFVNLVLIVDVTELAKIHDLVCDLSHMYVHGSKYLPSWSILYLYK